MKHIELCFFIALIFLLDFESYSQGREVADREGVKIIKGELIAKVKNEYRGVFYKKDYRNTPIEFLLSKFNVVSIERKYTQAISPRNLQNNQGEKLVDLSRIYTIFFQRG
jgi:hypothetical protein